MKTNSLTTIVILYGNLLFANVTEVYTNMNWIASMTNNHYWASSVSVTSTNLIIKYPPSGGKLMVKFDRWDHNLNTQTYSPQYNEDFIISTNRITELWHGRAEVGYEFTPVVFTNKMVGFRVFYSHSHYKLYDSNVIYYTNVSYIALSDTFVEVGERDVEGELDIDEKEPEPDPEFYFP